MTLTKADLTEAIYKKHDGVTKAEASLAIESFLRLSKDALISGDNVLLSGFGKFTVNDKRERRGRNPQTGEALMLSPRRVVTFRPSGSLRERVNNG